MKKEIKELKPSIPNINEIDVIKYQNEEGKTSYKLSVLEYGDRFIYGENLLEEVFTEYILDGNYEREKLESYMVLNDMIKYEYAKNHDMKKDCDSILTSTVKKLNQEAVKKGKAYILR